MQALVTCILYRFVTADWLWQAVVQKDKEERNLLKVEKLYLRDKICAKVAQV